ncbi:uncharacterized protein LOC110974871 isoform X2 [Acanthaster planci]|uniref:protein-tyrosine-phosphatase n=1 Tax=Acanthaster planci TaxID=133434 RepID=A0A8B7XQM9_ACAPL|nr:uncharacterized protein LOC110974871 isoform X2 [Acanthaster planci]
MNVYCMQALKQQSMRYKTEKTFSTNEGERDSNIRKNRYKDILPFDYTRIVLPEIEDVEGSDYINANYIMGVNGKNVYVAAQGPLPHTVNDFWRLLWETGVEVVIMACNEYESGKHKCEKYWADENETKQFGNVTVSLITQLRVTPDFMIRTLKASNQEEERVLNQFHYTAWPDHGVPKSVKPIMDMIQLFREYLPSEESVVVMHCSAGCGRTGTMICIDYVRALLKAGKVGADFCLYDIIMEMRKQRPAFVQTRDQYELVHRAVAWLFRKELGLAPNPHDFDHLYENVKLHNEGPRMPPGAGNLSPDIKPTQQLKLSPKQRRQKDKEQDHGHNYVNHVIQGKGSSSDGGSTSAPANMKILKPPSLPTKQQRDTDTSETVYANFQEKTDTEEKLDDACSSPAVTPKHSPLAQERFESGYKSTLAAFKEFEAPPLQVKPQSPKSIEQGKPTPRSKPVLSVSSTKSLDLDLGKPILPAKPPLSDKPAIGEKPVKVLPSTRPNLATKPAFVRKKDTASGGSPHGTSPSSGLKRRPTSEPVPPQDHEKVHHLGAAQFLLAKNVVKATLSNKSEGDDRKEHEVKKGKERRDSQGRPTSAPPKPPTAVTKPMTKTAATKHQPYEAVDIALPLGRDAASSDKEDSAKGFQYEIKPVVTVKLQSHQDKVDTKSPKNLESSLTQMQHRKTIDAARPQQPVPESGSSEYAYAVQPVNVIEKLKDAQSRPQLKTGQGFSYAYARDSVDDGTGTPKESSKSPKILDDYSYASDVIIPVTSVNRESSDGKNTGQSMAYEVIQISRPPSQKTSEEAGTDDIPVFDKGPGEYNEPNFISYRQVSEQSSSGQTRESVLSSTSWASFTDDDYDYNTDEQPPTIPVKTSAAYEYVDGEEVDEAGSGSSAKPKIAQFLANQRDKLATHKDKLTSNTKGFLTKIGDAVTRNAPASTGNRSSPPSTLSSSPQAGIVSDLNEIIKKTLREFEPTYKEEPNMFQGRDISFPKRVPSPKSPPPLPNEWIQSDTQNSTASVQL